MYTHTHTKCTYELTKNTSETTAQQRLRGQPNLTPRSSALLPVCITTARRPDHIRLSALVRSRSTQFIVHASSQLGHASPWPPDARSFFCHFGGVLNLCLDPCFPIVYMSFEEDGVDSLGEVRWYGLRRLGQSGEVKMRELGPYLVVIEFLMGFGV